MAATWRTPFVLTIVAIVYGLCGVATWALLVGDVPERWSGGIVTGLSAALAGVVAWLAVCGTRRRRGWLRLTACGTMAGLLVHPLFWILSGCLRGEVLGPLEVVIGIGFSLLVVGIVTVPAGMVAALCCSPLMALLPADAERSML